MIERLRLQRNTVPVLSIEGTPAETDARRGRGVHERLNESMAALREAGVFFSLSFTVTRATYDTVTDTNFLQQAVDQGCKFFLLLEYTPLRDGTGQSRSSWGWTRGADRARASRTTNLHGSVPLDGWLP